MLKQFFEVDPAFYPTVVVGRESCLLHKMPELIGIHDKVVGKTYSNPECGALSLSIRIRSGYDMLAHFDSKTMIEATATSKDLL